MKHLLMLVLLVGSVQAQSFFAYNGQCSKGGQAVVTQGLASSGTKPVSGGTTTTTSGVVASYPLCSVRVYFTGTTNLASIASDAIGTPLTQPFTANTDGSFLFYAVGGVGYDVNISGAGIPSPVTVTNIFLGGGTGGSSFYQTIKSNGTGQTQRPVFNLISGSGATVSCVDNAGQTETDCTFAATGSVNPSGAIGSIQTKAGATSFGSVVGSTVDGSNNVHFPANLDISGSYSGPNAYFGVVQQAISDPYQTGLASFNLHDIDTSLSGNNFGLSMIRSVNPASTSTSSSRAVQVLIYEPTSMTQSIAQMIGVDVTVAAQGSGNVGQHLGYWVQNEPFTSGNVTNNVAFTLQSAQAGPSPANILNNAAVDVQTGSTSTGSVTNDVGWLVHGPSTVGLVSHHHGVEFQQQNQNPSNNPDAWSIYHTYPSDRALFANLHFYANAGIYPGFSGGVPGTAGLVNMASLVTGKFMAAGTVAGASALLCTDASGNLTITTVQCPVAAPGGTTGQVNFNNAGISGGIPGSSADANTGDLVLGGNLTVSGNIVGASFTVPGGGDFDAHSPAGATAATTCTGDNHLTFAVTGEAEGCTPTGTGAGDGTYHKFAQLPFPASYFPISAPAVAAQWSFTGKSSVGTGAELSSNTLKIIGWKVVSNVVTVYLYDKANLTTGDTFDISGTSTVLDGTNYTPTAVTTNSPCLGASWTITGTPAVIPNCGGVMTFSKATANSDNSGTVSTTAVIAGSLIPWGLRLSGTRVGFDRLCSSTANAARSGSLCLAAADFLSWRDNTTKYTQAGQDVQAIGPLDCVTGEAGCRIIVGAVGGTEMGGPLWIAAVDRGTVTLGTSAIAATTCAAAVNTAVTGMLSTSRVMLSFNAAPTGAYLTGLVVLPPDVAAGSFNVRVCNPTAGSLTPPAATLNYEIAR